MAPVVAPKEVAPIAPKKAPVAPVAAFPAGIMRVALDVGHKSPPTLLVQDMSGQHAARFSADQHADQRYVMAQFADLALMERTLEEALEVVRMAREDKRG